MMFAFITVAVLMTAMILTSNASHNRHEDETNRIDAYMGNEYRIVCVK